MTHDELLEAIGTGETTRFALADALRAVVELHKPLKQRDRLSGEKITVCEHCETPYDSKMLYPCPTIQAIEKELK